MYAPSKISSFDQLSAYLRTSPEQLKVLAKGAKVIFDRKLNEITKNESPADQTSVFERFYIPKRNKRLGFRVVYKPKDQYTSDVLKVLKFNLDNIFKPTECVHGFVQGRNTKSNAAMHLAHKYLLKLDIENFFESINKDHVKHGFINLGFKDDIAEILSEISTLDGRLVQGFPSSPVIANLVCKQLDKELSELNPNWIYTRYADDISISSDIEPPNQNRIGEVVNSYGFKINGRKTQRFKRGQNQFVTGLSISDNKYPRIPKAIKKRIRQQLYYIGLHGYHSHICHINDWDEETDLSVSSPLSHQLRNKLKGWIDYIHSVEPDVALGFYVEFNQIEKKETEKAKRHMVENMPEDGIYVIDLEGKAPIPKRKK